MDNSLVKHLHNVGRAQHMIEELLSRDIFEEIGKHNPYWNSEHEIESEKLEEARCQLSGILYAIYEIQEALRMPEDDCE